MYKRAKFGLNSYNNESLHKISALTYKTTNSDVRVAIKTLFYHTTEAQNSIEANFEHARRDIVIDLIQDLNDKNLLILMALHASEDGFVKTAYNEYMRLSAMHHEKPFSYVYFYNNLSYMQSLGLILLLSAKIDRTYTNRVRLLFNERILEEIYRLRFSG